MKTSKPNKVPTCFDPRLEFRLPRQRAATFPLCVVLLLVLAFVGCRSESNQTQNGTGQQDGDRQRQTLAKLNEAIGAMENIEPDTAAGLWAELRVDYPNDESIALNTALNAVLRVDQLTTDATDSSKSKEEQRAARAKLPAAIESARKAIDAHGTLSEDAVTRMWLRSRIDAHEASLLPSSMTRSLQKELYQRLTDAIQSDLGKQPESIILGGPLSDILEQLADPIDGLDPELLRGGAAAFRTLSDQHADNLFLAQEALRHSVDEQSAESGRFAERTWSLAQAMEPTLAKLTNPIGVTPEQLKDRIVDAVSASDWSKAGDSVVPWSNVLRSLEILRTDGRRANPHPLDRLSFESVRQLSAKLSEADPVAKQPTLPAFVSTSMGEDVAMVLPMDADLDLDIDLISISSDNRATLWLSDAGKWQPNATLQLTDRPSGLISADLFMVDSSDPKRLRRNADFDKASDANPGDASPTKNRHDTLQGLIVFGDFGAKLIQVDARDETDAGAQLRLIEETSGLEDLSGVVAMIAGDMEGDGDLDLIAATEQDGLRVFVNRGNRTFFEAGIGSNSIDAADPAVCLAVADLDRDLDLDVITLHAQSGKVGILENLLHLQFRSRYLDSIPAVPSASNLFIEDVDSNVGWDVVVTSSENTQIAFGNSSDIGVWQVDRIQSGPGLGESPVIGDFDNDTYLELIASKGAGKLGPWGLESVGDSTTPPGQSNRFAVDLNANGNLDIVGVAEAKVGIAKNQSELATHHLSVRFKGIADNAASSGRVNHYGIGSVLELRFGPHYRSRIVTTPSTHFGLQSADSADSIRVIMPNGLTQVIRDPPVDAIVEEEQTLKGSCPYLYGWDGEQFAFITDCLWAAPLGLQVAAGRVQKDRPWEYLKIDGDKVRPNEEGMYELRMTEELWEVAYVDHVELIAVDHPADVDVFTNEKVGPPQIATPTIFAFAPEDQLHLVDSRDTNGDSVTKLLAAVDGQYVKGFDRRLRQGLCPPHWVDLDFGSTAKEKLRSGSDDSVLLVLTGWILPTDTSLNIQIDQNPELPPIEFPSVWVPDASSDSGWKNAIPFMGFPGGKTKTIVVDVTPQINHDDPRFRIRTSAQIYWDSASLVVQKKAAETMTRVLDLVDAEVAHHGFSRRIRNDESHPETYDYHDADSAPKWPPLRGSLTAWGPCLESLTGWDDRMVVISGGDEIRMRFRVPTEPVPKGWKRDFVLHCVGWDKDADLNTLTGQSIGPLPIRDMSAYPPTLASQDAFHAVLRKNAQQLRRRQSFRAFWHRDRHAEAFLRSQVERAPKQEGDKSP